VTLREEMMFHACPHCDSALYIEADRLYPRVVLAPVLTSWREAVARIERWAYVEYGRGGAQALGREIQEERQAEVQFFPVWVLRTGAGDTHIEPAAVTATSEMWKLDVMAGKAADTLPPDETLPIPEVPCNAALAWARRRGVEPSTIAEIGLAYVPVYFVPYQHENEPYSLLVEASTGRVLADYPPPTLISSWRVIGCLSVVGYLAISVGVGMFLNGITIASLTQAEPSAWLELLVPAPNLRHWPVFFLVWLAMVSVLVAIFSGRWKPFRWWRRSFGPN
jgi:hypothetical protein